MRLEADGVVEAALVLDAVDVEGADADAVAREADAHVALGQLLVVEERPDRAGERALVAHLTVDDDAGGKRAAGKTEQLVAAVCLGHDRSSELRGADLQSDDLAPLAALALGRLLRLALARSEASRRPRCVVGSYIRKIGDDIRVVDGLGGSDRGRHRNLVVDPRVGNVLGRGDVLECGDVVERGHILEGSDVVLRLLRGILRAPRVVGGAG